MIEKIKQLFGLKNETDYAELVKLGAIIVDVRTRTEYETGHIKGSINIPLDVLKVRLDKLGDKNKVIITCCASGMRSASACNTLSYLGYTQVFNGGGWRSLQNKL